MNMRLTITAVLLAIVSVIAAILIVPGSSEASERTATRKLLPAGAFDLEAVQAIDLARGDGTTLRFERDGENWNQVEPITHPMDAFSIRQLIVQAVEANVLGEVALEESSSGATADTLGLDPPVATLTFHAATGEGVKIKFGRRGLGGRAYAQLDGEEAVLVIDSELHDRAAVMDPREWRQRMLFRDVSIDADRIAFDAGTTRLELRRQHRQWLMTQPATTRADELKVEEYVANLAKAQVAGFILDQPDALDRFGLAPGVALLEVETGDKPVQRLGLGVEIGSSTGDRFALVDGRPVVVRINRATVQALFPAPETLIDPTASGVQAADVKTITIRAGTTELVFERDLERWLARSHDSVEVSSALVEELLTQLTELRAPGVSIEPYPMEKQVATVTFAGFDAKPIDTVRIVRDEETGQWGLENGDNVLRVFPASMKLRLSPDDYGLVGLTP